MNEIISDIPKADPNERHDTGPVFEYTPEQRAALDARNQELAATDHLRRPVEGVGPRGEFSGTRPDGVSITSAVSGDGMKYTRVTGNSSGSAVDHYRKAEIAQGLPEGSLTGIKPAEVAKKSRGFLGRLFKR